jgi:hypothetical protein
MDAVETTYSKFEVITEKIDGIVATMGTNGECWNMEPSLTLATIARSLGLRPVYCAARRRVATFENNRV